MSTKADKPTRAELLAELQELHASLGGNSDAVDETLDIPTLDTMLEEDDLASDLAETQEIPIVTPEKLPEPPAQTPIKTTAPKTSMQDDIPNRPDHVLPGQQSLFDEEAAKNASGSGQGVQEQTPPEQAKENPFLPKHVKDRLEKERSALEQLEQQLNTPTATSKAPHLSDNPSKQSSHNLGKDKEALIDEIVAEYLPKIESELRRRLRAQLDDE